MEERTSNLNTIPKNVAQSGYIMMFRIPNFIEAILIIGVFLIAAYYIPFNDTTWKRLLIGGGIGFIPGSLSLVGIKGETLTRVIINLIRNKKLAKVYGPPTDAYKRDYRRRQLQEEYKKNRKDKKNRAVKAENEKAGKENAKAKVEKPKETKKEKEQKQLKESKKTSKGKEKKKADVARKGGGENAKDTK